MRYGVEIFAHCNDDNLWHLATQTYPGYADVLCESGCVVRIDEFHCVEPYKEIPDVSRAFDLRGSKLCQRCMRIDAETVRNVMSTPSA